MTLFWHDHFVTSIQKVKQPVLMVRQNDLFRRGALGSAKDLTQAILMDPAMMLYLDTQSSKKGMPNENFAREVTELFTLGEGNYTEQDIRGSARAFIGYNLNFLNAKVVHNPRLWDSGEKTIFGNSGWFTGADVIGLISEKPEAARFVVRKLWEFFVYENPLVTALDALAASFRQADFQTGPLLREIFLSKEFYSEAAIRSQIKSPVQYPVVHGGFDTHNQQVNSHDRLLGQLDSSSKSFFADLKQQGNDKRVVLMTFSEFGRRVFENASAGTDHGKASCPPR